MLHVAILGGDRRFLALIETLSAYVDTLYTVGFDESADNVNVVRSSLENIPFEQLSAVIVPVQGIGDDGSIDVLNGQSEQLSTAHVERTNKDCIWITGVRTDFFTKIKDRKVMSFLDREDVAILNSIPTAEGCLQLAIEKTDHTIHGSQVCVFGYGRCGQTIADVFKGVGANVTVTTMVEKEEARAAQRGFQTLLFAEFEQSLDSFDIVINTIPAHVFTPNVLQQLKPSAFLLDISSKPGAFLKEDVTSLSNIVMNVPGLPGRVAPRTAGEILGEATRKILEKEFRHGS
ncbi:LOW QUALITY PROTEIN: dipicolinate synthase subunit A [Geomicrobium sp. JCM 19055]|nr:LOW QUALITY PROTEIN: dipicolinate synthase subunit A [Geomicrobium sp. JCM 19055]